MAETKTYVGMKKGYYGSRHEAKLDEYYIGPLGDKVEPQGMQGNPPTNADPHFGKPDKD